MAVVAANNTQARTVVSNAACNEELVEITFNLTGTYAQADNAEITDAVAEIQNSRRDGKTVTLRGVSLGQSALKVGTNTIMSMKTLAIATNKITFEVTDSDYATELANGAVPTQDRPFSIYATITAA